MTRRYTEAERQSFAAYVEQRARCRPAECHGGLDCWVDFGPPAMSKMSCLGCAGKPPIPPELQLRRGRRRKNR